MTLSIISRGNLNFGPLVNPNATLIIRRGCGGYLFVTFKIEEMKNRLTKLTPLQKMNSCQFHQLRFTVNTEIVNIL
jgi:hypothetical protein